MLSGAPIIISLILNVILKRCIKNIITKTDSQDDCPKSIITRRETIATSCFINILLCPPAQQQCVFSTHPHPSARPCGIATEGGGLSISTHFCKIRLDAIGRWCFAPLSHSCVSHGILGAEGHTEKIWFHLKECGSTTLFFFYREARVVRLGLLLLMQKSNCSYCKTRDT